jgi:hypothetical protein
LVDSLERKELEIVILVEPAALEELQRQAGSSGKGESVDRELDMGVRFLSRLRLIVKNVDVTIAELQKINVAGDHVLSNSISKPRLR